MPLESRAIRAAALLSVAFDSLYCSSGGEPDPGAEVGGTGAGATVTGGAGGKGGGAGASGTSNGGVGAAGAPASGAAGQGGAAPSSGGASGIGGTAAGMPSAGTGASGGGPGGAGAGGFSGNGATAGGRTGGAAGAGGTGGAGGGAGNAGTGGGGSGGAPNCTSRTGGAIIDMRACNQTMRFWITDSAFITEAIRLRGNGQSRIACFRLEDGRDCDPVLTFHANASNPYWTDFELETYFTCPLEVEGDKSFWLDQVGQFCGQMTQVTAVDDNR